MNAHVLIAIAVLPLLGAVIAGLFGRWIGRAGAHSVAIAGVAVSCALSVYVLKQTYLDGVPNFNAAVYT